MLFHCNYRSPVFWASGTLLVTSVPTKTTSSLIHTMGYTMQCDCILHRLPVLGHSACPSTVTFPWSCSPLMCGCWNLESLQTVFTRVCLQVSSSLSCSDLLLCAPLTCEKQMQENGPCNVFLDSLLEDFIPQGAV